MKLKVLGTQSSYTTPTHNCPGFLITTPKANLMLDCGSGSHGLLTYPNDLQNLHVIISHLHRDHYNDIYNLQYASFVFRNQKRLNSPIHVYLPSTPVPILNDIVNENNSFSEYAVINEQSKLKIGDMDISFCKTDHPLETYAIKVSSFDKTLVYTSDTSFSAKDKLVDFSKGADLLICESNLLKAYGFPEINSHLTAEQAGIIAKEAMVDILMLTHFWPEEAVEKFVAEAQKIFPNTIPAIENQVINLF